MKFRNIDMNVVFVILTRNFDGVKNIEKGVFSCKYCLIKFCAFRRDYITYIYGRYVLHTYQSRDTDLDNTREWDSGVHRGIVHGRLSFARGIIELESQWSSHDMSFYHQDARHGRRSRAIFCTLVTPYEKLQYQIQFEIIDYITRYKIEL